MDRISISRYRTTRGKTGIEIEITAKNKMIYRGSMTLEDFAKVITNQGHVLIDRSLPVDDNASDIEEETYREWLNTPDHGQE